MFCGSRSPAVQRGHTVRASVKESASWFPAPTKRRDARRRPGGGGGRRNQPPSCVCLMQIVPASQASIVVTCGSCTLQPLARVACSMPGVDLLLELANLLLQCVELVEDDLQCHLGHVGQAGSHS